MKHSFWTQSYKGHYIHGNSEEITIQIMKPDGSFTLYGAKSLHAAKYKITRIIGGH